MNEIEQLRQTARGVWPQLEPLVQAESADAVRFYRAAVVTNPGGGQLSVARQGGEVVTVPCSSGLQESLPGQEVLVLVMGSGEQAQIAVCSADPAQMSDTLLDLEAAVEPVAQQASGYARSLTQQYTDLRKLVLSTAGGTYALSAGRPIDTVTVLYYLSTMCTDTEGGTWQVNCPPAEEGKYLWTKLHITYADEGEDTETEPVCALGPGNWSVWRVRQQFLASPNREALTSAELTGDGWTDRAPVLGEGEYLWTRQMILYTLTPQTEDGSTVVGTSCTDPYCLSAAMEEAGRLSTITVEIDGVKHELESLSAELSGGYVAISDFGSYLEEINNRITGDETGLEQYYRFFSDLKANLSRVQTAFEQYTVATEGYIRTGIVDYDGAVPIYGVAVGQDLQTTVDPVTGDPVIEKKSFRAIYSGRDLSFWQDGVKVAWVSDNTFHLSAPGGGELLDVIDEKIAVSFQEATAAVETVRETARTQGRQLDEARQDLEELRQTSAASLQLTREGIVQELSEARELLLRQIDGVSDALTTYREATEGVICTGIVDYDGDTPIYGMAIGQKLVTAVDSGTGDTIIKKENFRAVYTANRLSFWNDGTEVAYMSGNELYITNVVALETLKIGEWMVSNDPAVNGLVFRWIGG